MTTAINAKLGPNETAKLFPVGLPETSFMITNWCSVDIEKSDFGIGLPSIMRVPDVPIPSLIPNFGILFPSCQQSPEVHDLLLCLTAQKQVMLKRMKSLAVGVMFLEF